MRVPFTTGQDILPGDVLRFRVVSELQSIKASAGHLRLFFHPGNIQQCGSQVDEQDQVIHHPVPRNGCRPADGKWHVGPVLLEVGLGSREGHPIIGRDNDDRIFLFPLFLQEFQHFAQMLIKPLDL
jgi:hypothetical protein